MKRRAPLRAKTQLRNKTELKRKTQLRNTGLSGGARPVPTPGRAPSTLPKVSKKRAKANKQRTEMLRPGRLDPQICAVPWCTQVGGSPHEPLTRARGGNITDPDNLIWVCWPHNQELTLEPPWGYRLGLLIHSWDGAA